MIVHNEADQLADCLNAVRPYVDEIVIVDTGSGDGTPAMAEQLGAVVYRMAWEEHFAKARNHGLLRAKGDWILVLDADERLALIDPAAFRLLLADEETAGYFLTIRHHRSNHPDDYESDRICRLFRRDQGVRYEGRVHEEITASLNRRFPRLAVKQAPLLIAHYGYLRLAAHNGEKSTRNRRLLEQALREESDGMYYRYALGVEAFIAEDYAAAAETWAPLARLVPPSAGYSGDLACKLSYALWRCGDWPAAREAAANGLARHPAHADLLEQHSLLLLTDGQPEEALHYLRRLADSSQPGDPAQQGRTQLWLGQTHAQLGNWRTAVACLERCLTAGVMLEQALPRWLELVLALEPFAEVAPRLQAWLSPTHSAQPGSSAQPSNPAKSGNSARPGNPANPQSSLGTATGSASLLRQLVGRVALEHRCATACLPILEATRSGSADDDWELAFIDAVQLAQSGQPGAARTLLERMLQVRPDLRLRLFHWAITYGSNPDTWKQEHMAISVREGVAPHPSPSSATPAPQGHEAPRVSGATEAVDFVPEELRMALFAAEALTPANRSILHQAAYVLLLVQAWPGFLHVWERLYAEPPQAGASTTELPYLPKSWRHMIAATPAKVRERVLQTLTVLPSLQIDTAEQAALTPEARKTRFSLQLFTAALTFSLGDQTTARTRYRNLIEAFPQRLSPRIGLYTTLTDAQDRITLLLLADE
jgi:tetratricopeptide (TPR) repeat protein